VGGLTPYPELLRQIRAESAIPIRCLMRPRGGDFLYMKEEIDMMARQIAALRHAGADGFVIGCLDADGRLDTAAMQPLLDAAHGCGLTLHRCIDVSRDPLQTYRDAAACGIDTVLTSGAAANCVAGQSVLAQLLALRDEIRGPEVLIGAGVNAAVITQLRQTLPGARAFHASCKAEVESGMRFRRDGVPMGLPGLDEWHIQQTAVDAVQLAKAALEETP
jgi:copper homeostasis protein